uniref:Odorant receptor n=1 Tax=Epiphyas postvittana TaxID=65032 RepID=A0A0K8TU74_EPIPO
MIKSILDSLEDANRPLFGPNYWLLNKIGLILPDNTFERIYYILIHEIVTFFVFTQYMELYVIRSDLDLVLTNLKISMLSIVCVVKANTFVIWQNNWRQVIDYINSADKFERDNQDEAKRKIIHAYTKYCRRVTYFYWVLVFTTFVTVVTTPLMKWYSSSTFREGFRNGTEAFPHIFSSWMPIDKEHSPGSWITVVWHTGLCAYGATIMAAYDTSVMVILVYFGGKLDLLRERCKEMLVVAGEVKTDKDADAAVKQLHEIHVMLLKHSRLFNSVLSPVMFVYVVMCSLMICASAFQLTSATNKTQKLLMAEYLIFGIAQLFMFCWHSNDVIYKSRNVMMGPYESKWWTASLQLRKSVVILQGQLRIVHIYTAGPFTDLTLSTFVAILKGAYSYYTLLRK